MAKVLGLMAIRCPGSPRGSLRTVIQIRFWNSESGAALPTQDYPPCLLAAFDVEDVDRIVTPADPEFPGDLERVSAPSPWGGDNSLDLVCGGVDLNH